MLAILVVARAPLKLKANFGDGSELPADHRGDEDNVSPPISWTGAPKNTESYVLIVDSSAAGADDTKASKTHWLVYDIPKEVTELREELSGAGSSDVARLGMKDDAGQAPVVRAHIHPRGHGSQQQESTARACMRDRTLEACACDVPRARHCRSTKALTTHQADPHPN